MLENSTCAEVILPVLPKSMMSSERKDCTLKMPPPRVRVPIRVLENRRNPPFCYFSRDKSGKAEREDCKGDIVGSKRSLFLHEFRLA